jgi:hypothetical protein
MQDAPLQIDLGSVETLIGNLQVTFVVNGSGDAHSQVYATDPSDVTKSGVVVMLDATGRVRVYSFDYLVDTGEAYDGD